MSKAVLLSIRLEWCELIASGRKTIEVRKTKPKLETPFKCYIYCTKDEPLYHSGEKFWIGEEFGNGKVIGEFVCDGIISHCEMANADLAEKNGYIKREKLFEYSNGKELFGWHISDLVIYEKPKNVSFFCHPCDRQPGCDCSYCKRHRGNKAILRPPQSWCYVEEVPHDDR